MTRLAQALKHASEDVLNYVGLESLASQIETSQVSMETHMDDLNQLIDLADGLQSIVVTVESMDEPTLAQQNALRGLALTQLTQTGLTVTEATNIFPSLEAEKSSSGWEKFKAFILRLWEVIVKAAKVVYDFVSKALKQNSVAEAAAIVKIRQLRSASRNMRGAISVKKAVPLRPAHRYFFTPQGEVTDVLHLRASVQEYIKVRDNVQKKLPETILKVMTDLMTVVGEFALSGDDAQISASIESKGPKLMDAIAPMFPDNLARSFGIPVAKGVPLIYDRVVRVDGEQADYANMNTDEIKNAVRTFGISVAQVDHPVDENTQMGEFRMTTINEVSELLDLAAGLIDSTHSADMEKQWRRLKTAAASMTLDVGSVLRVLLDKRELSPEARSIIALATACRHAVNRWVSSPFGQFDTVNIRVVNAVLAMAEDQIKNYEIEDGAEQRAETKRAEEARRKEKQEKKQ